MIYVSYCLLAIELVLGGGGRIFAVHDVPVRFLLFSWASILLFVFLIRNRHFDRLFILGIGISLCFCSLFVYSLLLASINNNQIFVALNDVKISFLWILFPMFVFLTKNERWNMFFIRLCISGALLLSVIQLALVLGLFSGMVAYLDFYRWAYETEEFFFRSEYFLVYKGHIFIVVGLVGCYAIRPRMHVFYLSIMILALATTMTRGFFISSLLGVWVVYVLQGRKNLLYGFFLLIVLVSLGGYLLFLLQNVKSDSVRLEDFSYIVDSFDIQTMVGHGAGAFINGRVAIENAYLNILYKFGIIGLVIWLVPILSFYLLAFRVYRYGSGDSAVLKFGISSVSILCFQSLFNPYLTNSMGVLILMFWLAFVLRRNFNRESFCRNSYLQR